MVDVLEVAHLRIREIVEAADRAASDVRDVVAQNPALNETDPNRISRQRVAAELAGGLIDRTQALRREALELAALLERARRRLGAAGPVARATPAETPKLRRRGLVRSAGPYRPRASGLPATESASSLPTGGVSEADGELSNSWDSGMR